MGKSLIQQARGKGSLTYRAPSFNYRGRACYCMESKDDMKGIIKDLVDCPGHSAPLAEVKFANGEEVLQIAPEGVRVGDELITGEQVELKPGNAMLLKNIPEGTLVFNIESRPGDGGKFCRSSGTCAKVLSKMRGRVVIQLPSKKEREFVPECRASIGVIAGGGRPEKPFVKAGTHYFAMKARNKIWPHVNGTSQNAVDHPFGGSSSCHKGRPTIAPNNAPPGRKVGKVRPRRTGYKR